MTLLLTACLGACATSGGGLFPNDPIADGLLDDDPEFRDPVEDDEDEDPYGEPRQYNEDGEVIPRWPDQDFEPDFDISDDNWACGTLDVET